ncbi:ROK family transcriptional regulator [Rhodococcoides fascians]|uniref:ROK family transcriptional regulator n=1 Tax=Rhodococcoides fascians TaxID=1828 RepID=UPI000567FD41|nr:MULTISPECIES: ROK family transcriptional regulator [Rhodococcus]OZF06335.1 ROK family transcriptional regulator [Rhodococcus sp. 15-1189-1-1a]OZF21103.1 ROK family transcriptional regulator [Rhodococcus sp. 14-2686-1-2]
MPSLPARSVRTPSDEAVLRALMVTPRSTRAELAVATGLSKPTTADSVRRLVEAGLVVDTGQRTNGRGGVGTYYALSERIGVALVVSVAPDGVVAETIDTTGTVIARGFEPIDRSASEASAARSLVNSARTATVDIGPSTVRLAMVSAADPVDRASGSLVQLPDAPFLVGTLSPKLVLEPFVGGAVYVDNDTNWAARAERDSRRHDGSDGSNFVYLYLGEGLGCAIVTDGEVRRGHSGLAGEVAHVSTTGADGRATPFITVFEQLGLRHPNSTAIDVDAVLGYARNPADTLGVLANAVCDVLSSAIAFCDPGFVVVAGPWGAASPLFEAIQQHVEQSTRSVPLERPRVGDDASLLGARAAALIALRSDVVSRGRI